MTKPWHHIVQSLLGLKCLCNLLILFFGQMFLWIVEAFRLLFTLQCSFLLECCCIVSFLPWIQFFLVLCVCWHLASGYINDKVLWVGKDQGEEEEQEPGKYSHLLWWGKIRDSSAIRLLSCILSSHYINKWSNWECIPLAITDVIFDLIVHLYTCTYFVFPLFFSLATATFAFSLAMLILSGSTVITSILLIVALCGVSQFIFFSFMYWSIHTIVFWYCCFLLILNLSSSSVVEKKDEQRQKQEPFCVSCLWWCSTG